MVSNARDRVVFKQAGPIAIRDRVEVACVEAFFASDNFLVPHVLLCHVPLQVVVVGVRVEDVRTWEHLTITWFVVASHVPGRGQGRITYVRVMYLVDNDFLFRLGVSRALCPIFRMTYEEIVSRLRHLRLFQIGTVGTQVSLVSVCRSWEGDPVRRLCEAVQFVRRRFKGFSRYLVEVLFFPNFYQRVGSVAVYHVESRVAFINGGEGFFRLCIFRQVGRVSCPFVAYRVGNFLCQLVLKTQRTWDMFPFIRVDGFVSPFQVCRYRTCR